MAVKVVAEPIAFVSEKLKVKRTKELEDEDLEIMLTLQLRKTHAFYVGDSIALLRQIRTAVDERIEKSIESAYLRNKEIHIMGDFNIDCLKTAPYMYNASVNFSCAQPIPPPPQPGYCGAFARLFSPRVGHLQHLPCPWTGYLPTPGLFPSF